MRNLNITSGSKELLDRVEPLWEELIAFHIGIEGQFSTELSERTFEKRKKELIDSAKILYIAIVSDVTDVGYCISSIDGYGKGEIDSLYVKKEYRSKGLGKKLTESALQWLDENNAKRKVVVVFEKNTDALAFYQKFGFYPRNVELEYTK